MIEEVEQYLQARQDLADVSKGGQHYAECSFMDISARSSREEEEAKEKAIKALGETERVKYITCRLEEKKDQIKTIEMYSKLAEFDSETAKLINEMKQLTGLGTDK